MTSRRTEAESDGQARLEPGSSARVREWLARAAVTAWPFLFYWRAALGLGMFYFGDIARLFYPTRLLYAEALRAGRLPLWTPEILAGFPLFAEMETGALYPPHLLLYRLLPLDLAINYEILLHLAWLGLGMYLFARARGLSLVGALVAAFALSAGGFGAGRITHLNVLAVAAWVPWLLLLYEKWRRSPRVRWLAVLAVCFALQFLAGHPQFMLLSVLTFAAYAIGAALNLLDEEAVETDSFLHRAMVALLPLLSALLAAGLAAVQLLPTLELAQATARAGGVTQAFFTEFSFHPALLALLVEPFILGNPYPRVSVEVIAYLGVLPLLLAVAALWWRRNRVTLFWAALALASFALALGGYNPLYRYIRLLPLVNFFRVPARFLFPFMLALAILAGMGLDTLWARARAAECGRTPKIIGVSCLVLILVVVGLTPLVSADDWVRAWGLLSPLFFALALWIILLASRGRLSRASLAATALGLTLLDLAAFGAVYAQTFNVIAPRGDIFSRPRVLGNLDLANGARILTGEWTLPWVPGMRESLYPNLNAAYGVSSPAGYTPLVPLRTQEFLDHLSPAMLNLLGVRYYLIPQVLPVDPNSEAEDLADPFMLNPLDNPLDFSPTPATGIEVESSLSQSVNLKDGVVVATINLTAEDGGTYSVPLRAGLDTAEWAYERSDVRRVVKHSEPPIASTFPARSAFPVEAHVGHTYRADLSFSATPVSIKRIAITAASNFAAGLIHIQKLTLTNGGEHIDVATLVGKSNHRLVYRSEDVAVFENPDYAPRAFLTHSAAVESDDAALALLQSPDYSGELLLADGQELPGDEGQGLDEKVTIAAYEPERVVLEVSAAADAYVVLTDAWDPGWLVLVDGQPAPLQRADLIFRAVRVTAGAHRVEFLYRPRSFYFGILLSITSLALLGSLVCAAWLIGRLTRRPVI